MREETTKEIDMRLLIVMTMLVGCGTAPVIDERLEAYYDEFMQDADRLNIDMSKFKTIDSMSIVEDFEDDPEVSEEAIGICILTPASRTIEIKASTMDDDILKAIVYHELGHCVLNLGHHDGDELNIMNSMTSWGIYEDWDNRVETLFMRHLNRVGITTY